MKNRELFDKVAENILRYNLLESDKCVVVALSGGADSVALLSVLSRLGYCCVAAHCNFHMRGEESNRDEAHAAKIAGQFGVEFEVVHFDVDAYKKKHKVSTEMACRELRYGWFEQLRREYKAQAIAVAHHGDDDVETMFLNLLRGSGIAGVSAMRWKNGFVVRPMLNVPQGDIKDYLSVNSIDYVVDSTNNENEYKRNRLRNEVLPLLKDAFPEAGVTLLKSLRFLKENRDMYASAIAEAMTRFRKGNVIELSRIVREYVSPRTLLFEMLYPLGFNLEQVEDMVEVVDGSGQKFFSSQWVAVLTRGKIQLREIGEYENQDEEYVVDLSKGVESPIKLQVEMISREDFSPQRIQSEMYLDESVLEGNPRFVLRRWREGDRMKPFGMRGTKKLSDIFSDAKLSVAEKKRVWILERNGIILWVVGIKTSNNFRVNDATQRILSVKNLQMGG